MVVRAVVEALERKILPHLAAAAKTLRERHPCLTINTWSSHTGSLTEYQGHDVGIDCLNPAALESEPNNVALIIGVQHLTTRPLLCEAHVVWGSGGPVGGIDLLPKPVPWSEEVIQRIENQLPELIQCLENELEHLDRMSKSGRT
jgi:hypothetical protein